ncbi:hypothetical protein J3P96_03550 [Pseudomonas sp. R3-56]
MGMINADLKRFAIEQENRAVYRFATNSRDIAMQSITALLSEDVPIHD